MDIDAADLETTQREGLGGEDIADLTGTNPKGNGSECTVGGGVGISAGDGHAGMRETLFRTDNMDDALLAGWQIKKGNTEFLTIFSECLQHLCRKTIGKWFNLVLRWNDMIDGGEGSLRVGDGESKVPQHPKSLGAGDLVYEVHPDKELGPFVG